MNFNCFGDNILKSLYKLILVTLDHSSILGLIYCQTPKTPFHSKHFFLRVVIVSRPFGIIHSPSAFVHKILAMLHNFVHPPFLNVRNISSFSSIIYWQNVFGHKVKESGGVWNMSMNLNQKVNTTFRIKLSSQIVNNAETYHFPYFTFHKRTH